jgi:hypothetical protein
MNIERKNRGSKWQDDDHNEETKDRFIAAETFPKLKSTRTVRIDVQLMLKEIWNAKQSLTKLGFFFFNLNDNIISFLSSNYFFIIVNNFILFFVL